MSNPYGGGPDEPGRIRGWAVAVGIVVGLFGSFVWMVFVFATAYSTLETGGGSTTEDALVSAALLLPVPVSILLLCFRRTRQAAAGLVMGMAIGTLVLAGLCSSLIVPGLVV